jgi:predicted MFS family arabinose efflux permease
MAGKNATIFRVVLAIICGAAVLITTSVLLNRFFESTIRTDAPDGILYALRAFGWAVFCGSFAGAFCCTLMLPVNRFVTTVLSFTVAGMLVMLFYGTGAYYSILLLFPYVFALMLGSGLAVILKPNTAKVAGRKPGVGSR